MFTQCPECMTVFALDADTLARAHGHVACNQCGASFDSIATLCDTLPEEPFETLPVNQPASAPPLLLRVVPHELPPQQRLFATGEAAGGEGDSVREEPGTDAALDRVLRRRPAPRARGSRRLILACAALAVLLTAQILWAERARLVRNPALTPAFTALCAQLGCSLPAARDLARLKLGSRDIRRHPSVPGALLISATVQNRAPFPQPWPVVSIRLANLQDQPVALRRFRPAEYLSDPATRARGLAPGASAALMFEVLDPGQDAVAFEFGFL